MKFDAAFGPILGMVVFALVLQFFWIMELEREIGYLKGGMIEVQAPHIDTAKDARQDKDIATLTRTVEYLLRANQDNSKTLDLLVQKVWNNE